MHILDIIRRPLVTEKNSLLKEKNKYAFEVVSTANKRQVKEAVELAFKVKVTDVNVITVPGKTKRMGRRLVKSRAWKKAVVTLEPGYKIEIFEGV
ncbi:MAG: 50S ribosomal protein L23 [Dehalococcoidia bacterium]|nr:50S ribosomal protein L23 [Dehalococcoidia bacterium]